LAVEVPDRGVVVSVNPLEEVGGECGFGWKDEEAACRVGFDSFDECIDLVFRCRQVGENRVGNQGPVGFMTEVLGRVDEVNNGTDPIDLGRQPYDLIALESRALPWVGDEGGAAGLG